MSMTREVETSLGTWTLRKPKAGVRNRAMIKAETGFGGFKNSILLFELLPKCVQKRPSEIDQDVPIDQILDNLETEDYDLLADVVREMINPTGEGLEESYEIEEKKKPSETSSTQEDSQIKSNSESG